MKILLGCLLGICVVFHAGVFSEAQEENSNNAILTALIAIDKSENPNHTAKRFYRTVKMGSFKSGEQVQAVLELKNLFEEPIVFDNARPSCSCESLTLPAQQIAPGQTAVAKLKFKIGNGSGSDGLHKASFSLYRNGAEVGVITIACEVTEKLFFVSNHQQVLNVNDSLFEYKLPLRFSSPIDAKNLKVSLKQGSFENLEVQTNIVSVEKNFCMVTLSTFAGDMRNSFSSGTVIVTDSESGKTAEAVVLFHKLSPVEVSPKEIMLVKSEDDEGLYEATALIRVLAESEKADNQEEDSRIEKENEEKTKMHVNAVLSSGEEVKLENKQIGGRIVRSKLYVNSQLIKKGVKLIWEIEANDQTYSVVTELSR